MKEQPASRGKPSAKRTRRLLKCAPEHIIGKTGIDHLSQLAAQLRSGAIDRLPESGKLCGMAGRNASTSTPLEGITRGGVVSRS